MKKTKRARTTSVAHFAIRNPMNPGKFSSTSRWLLIFLFFSCLWACLAQASSLVDLKQSTKTLLLYNEKESRPLWSYLEILEDPTRKLTIYQVTDGGQNFKFNSVPHDRYRLDDANSAYWLRFKVKNQSGQQQEWWLVNRAFWSDYSDLYISRPEGGWTERKNGVMLPLSSKEIQSHLSVESLSVTG